MGLLHISKMKNKVKDAREKYKIGDKVKVKVVEIDDLGRPRFAEI